MRAAADHLGLRVTDVDGERRAGDADPTSEGRSRRRPGGTAIRPGHEMGQDQRADPASTAAWPASRALDSADPDGYLWKVVGGADAQDAYSE